MSVCPDNLKNKFAPEPFHAVRIVSRISFYLVFSLDLWKGFALQASKGVHSKNNIETNKFL